MGLKEAGFEVIGVDCFEQKNYPFKYFCKNRGVLVPVFHRCFDFIWAYPPGQKFSSMRRGRWKGRKHPDWIGVTRKLLVESGRPYCIENVVGSPLRKDLMLCGSMFNLKTKHGAQLRRHRIFELSFPAKQLKCKHKKAGNVIGVYGGGQHPQRRRVPATIGVYGHAGGSSKRDYLDFSCFTTQDRRDAMGIQWMVGKELVQAVPPAYARYIAKELIKTFVDNSVTNT